MFLTTSQAFTSDDFNLWLKNFKLKAINSGISKEVVNDVMSGAKFLPKVIEYDHSSNFSRYFYLH